ncbi:hypothetical protein BX286_6480 [Streptomyces sp. 3211.6]|uniref:DUF3040 domain-containing protein n=1 Tax=unclassified Streptomyces TaxID=2593676 RepID=UPI000CB0277A|nr:MULTISPECIES: DUF3040 domain-containing protein [unclassified Streptomyces]RKT08384.1 hypothetical protein BX286_6480 [Streptomyces sp. 3211.6]RPF29782.1 DUF3040 family protein [Streptomyces sp. Ag109_G2-6]
MAAVAAGKTPGHSPASRREPAADAQEAVMDGSGLSHRERRALTAIERALRADPRFDRAMTFGTRLFPQEPDPAGRPRGARHGALTGTVCAMAVAALALLPLAVATSEPALIAAFTFSYAATLAGLFVLVRRWCRRGG